MGDVGVQTTDEIITYIRQRVKDEKIGDTAKIKDILKEKIASILEKDSDEMKLPSPSVLLVVGVNGVGKTTLFRILLKQLQPVSGDIKYGTGIDIGYYDQEQSSLTPDNTAIEELWNAFPHLTETQIRNTLALFLFKGDDVYKSIRQLSGGERGRIMLAKLMLAENNFLLMDEPTNHLDMASKEVLEQSLADYPGTLLTISHDRYFLNKIVHRILLFEKDGITEYLGNYDDYVERKNKSALESLQGDEPVAKSKTALKEERRKEREERQKRRALAQLLKDTEENISALEDQAKELENLLYDPDLYKEPDRMLEIQQQYNEVKAALEAAYEDWLELHDED